MNNDDSMLSTPSSNPDADESIITNSHEGHEGYAEADDDEMFPDQPNLQNRPRTPQNDHLNAAAPGELSPPRSQTNARDRDTEMQRDGDIDLSPTNPNLGASGAGGPGDSQDTEWKAGMGWKNKKAQMEMHKAMEGFSDKDFDPRQFGDVLAHRIGLETGQH